MKILNYAIIPFVVLFLLSFSSRAQIITTIAGDSTAGYNGDNIPAVSAELNQPIGIALDHSGNLYICDRQNNRIRKVSPAVGGIITTIAGTGVAGFSGDDSAATNAKISSPYGIAVDASGNIYFSDDYNNRIRKISASGIITTIAGTGSIGFSGDNGPATAATMNAIGGLAIDGTGNIYFADLYNDRIRKINTTGVISTVVGGGTTGLGDGGPATNAEIISPEFVAVDATGNIYVSESAGERVRMVNTAGIISTIAGTGVSGYSGDGFAATTAKLYEPYGIVVDGSGNIYICDVYNNCVRKINSSGIITTIAGTGTGGYNGEGENATSTELHSPVGIAIDGSDNIYVSDVDNGRIRYMQNTVFVNPVNGKLSINLYPNPSKGHFIIAISSTINEHVRMVIANVTGETIKEINAVTNKPIEVQLDEPSGIYFIHVTTSYGTQIEKIILMR